MPAVAEAAIQIVPDFDRFGRELDTGLKRSLRSAGGTFRAMGKFAAQATAAVGGALGIIGASSLKASADLEKSMQMIEGLVGITDPAQLESFADAIQKIAPTTGQSATELGKAMFFITSAGARGATAIEILDSTARLGAAGLGDLSEIARGIVSSVNAYGEANLNAAQAADIFANTVRLGNLEASTLAPQLGMVIPIASQMGVGLDQVGGALAGLTRLGMNAANATTSLRATLNQILSPSVQSEQALAKVGLTFEQLRDALSSGKLDLLGVLELLKKAFDGNTAAISEAFPNLRALRAVLGLVGSNMEDNRMIMDAMADSTGVANEAYEAQVGTLQFELNQMLSAYKTMNIAVGDTLAKYVIPILDRMTAMFERQAVTIPLAIDKFAMYFNLLRGDDSVEEFNKKMVEAFGVSNVAFKKDYAPMLIELRDQSRRVFDNVKLAINLLVESFKKNFGDLIPVVDTTGFTIENFANLIILVINKVSSYLAFTGFPKIRKFMDNAKEQFERFKPILDAVREKFKVIFDAVLEIVEIFRSQYNKINENFGGEIRKFVTDVKDFFVSRFQALIDTVLGIVKVFTALFSGDFSLFKEGLIQLLTGLFNWFYASFKFFFDKARLIIQAGLLIVKNLFKFAFRGVIELLDFLIMGVVNGIVKLGQLMKQGFNVALDFVKKLWSDFKEWISNYWTGVLIPFIKDQVAKFNEFVGKIGRFILETLPEMIGNGVRKIFDWFRDWFGSGGKLRAVIEGFMDNMMSRIEKGLAKAVEFFKTGFTKIKDFISGFAGKIANTVGGIFDRIKQTIIDKITNMIGSLNKVIDRYNKLVPSALRVDKIPTPNFDGAALGGTISSAGSVLVGETGPELLNLPTGASITPLPTSSMSGIDPALQRALGKTVNVTIELDSEVIANKTAPIMVDEIRLRQGIGIV